ncbi:hypothetical protein P3L10_016788 [Capsicum annuum]
MAENTTTDEAAPVILGDESTNSNIACQIHSVQTTVKKERKGLVHGIILDHLLMKKNIRNQGVSIVFNIILPIQIKMVPRQCLLIC